MILPYIEKDPKAFFTPEAYRKARDTMIRFAERRAESVRRQMNGQLAANTELQKSEDRVDTSDISIRDMGGLPERQ